MTYSIVTASTLLQLLHQLANELSSSREEKYLSITADWPSVAAADVSARLVYAASRALRGREAVGVKEVQAARRRVASWLAYRGHGPSTAAQVLKRIGL